MCIEGWGGYGGAIFFSSHVLEVVEKLCDRVGIIKNGKLVKEGAVDDLIGDESLESLFADIADAIRAQSSSDEQIPADHFAAEIDALGDNKLLLSILDGSITELPVEVLEDVECIGASAFRNTTLKTLTIPGNVLRIEQEAFYNSLLTSVVMLEGVQYIGDGAFETCFNLSSVVLPSTINEIGNEAFYSCNNLSDVYYTGTEEQWNSIAIGLNNDCLTTATIHYNYIMEVITDGSQSESTN